MANSQETNVNLKINRVPNKATLEDMVANNQIQPNQLYMLPSELGLGVVTMQTKVLWTNPNPTSNFNAQSVSLEENINNYDYFIITYLVDTTSAFAYYDMILIKELGQLTYLNRQYNLWGNRDCHIDKTNNKMVFSDTYYGSSSSLLNSALLPQKIIGVKLIESPTQITNKYSTEETVVGEWIDGKKIYRKVFEFINNTSNTIIQNISDINYDKVITLKVINNNSDPISESFYDTSNSSYMRVFILPNETKFAVTLGTTYPQKPNNIYVILEYTKTTG